MARPRKAQVEVSLFPFLSILACVIGILVLILCSVIISQIDPQGVEELKQANEENLKKLKQLDELELELLALKEELEKVDALQTKKIDFKSKILKLKAEIGKKKKEQQALVSKNTKVNELNEELALKMAQKAKLMATLEEKMKLHDFLVAALNKEKERLHSKLKIEATGSGFLADSTPIYVECNDKGITLIGEQTVEIPRGALPKNKQWQTMLKAGSKNQRKVFVFLLRPSFGAVSNYWYAKSFCDKSGARSAKIPLTSNAPLSVGGI
ncbi:MAG: hypothetical protein MK132_20050 [Lentisphaerales bacterium]|nr:hypothetical protein [Lentisphaerales bacterium]